MTGYSRVEAAVVERIKRLLSKGLEANRQKKTNKQKMILYSVTHLFYNFFFKSNKIHDQHTILNKNGDEKSKRSNSVVDVDMTINDEKTKIKYDIKKKRNTIGTISRHELAQFGFLGPSTNIVKRNASKLKRYFEKKTIKLNQEVGQEDSYNEFSDLFTNFTEYRFGEENHEYGFPRREEIQTLILRFLSSMSLQKYRAKHRPIFSNYDEVDAMFEQSLVENFIHKNNRGKGKQYSDLPKKYEIHYKLAQLQLFKEVVNVLDGILEASD